MSEKIRLPHEEEKTLSVSRILDYCNRQSEHEGIFNMKKLSSVVVPVLLLILLAVNFWAYASLNRTVRKVQDFVSVIPIDGKTPATGQPYGRIRQIFIFDQALQFPKGGVLLFGDSITDDLWFTEMDGVPVLNAGVGGSGIDWLMKPLPKLVEITKPRAVVVTIGVNDIPSILRSGSKEKAEKEWCQKFAGIMDSILASGAVPVPSTILPIKREPRLQPWTDQIQVLNKEIKRIAKEKNLILCDSYAALAAPDGFMGSSGMKDDLHPSTESNLKWRKVLENSIRQALERANSQAPRSAQ